MDASNGSWPYGPLISFLSLSLSLCALLSLSLSPLRTPRVLSLFFVFFFFSTSAHRFTRLQEDQTHAYSPHAGPCGRLGPSRQLHSSTLHSFFFSPNGVNGASSVTRWPGGSEKYCSDHCSKTHGTRELYLRTRASAGVGVHPGGCRWKWI